MPTLFPTGLDSFTNPTPADQLSTVAVLHTDEHSNANDAIEALEARVGIDGSAVASSLTFQVNQLIANAFPVGGIIMWSGLLVNIPNGWALCDGMNGTPDLRGQFIKG